MKIALLVVTPLTALLIAWWVAGSQGILHSHRDHPVAAQSGADFVSDTLQINESAEEVRSPHAVDGALAARFTESHYQKLARTDPVAAASELAAELGGDPEGKLAADPRLRTDLLFVASQYGLKMPEEALQWSKNLELTHESTDPLVSAILTQLAASEPERAGELAATEIHSDQVYEKTLASVMQRMALASPDRVGAWLNQVEDSGDFARLTTLAIGPWLKADPKAVAAWVESLQDPLRQDQAIAAYAAALFAENPELAIQHLDMISDPEIRANLRKATSDIYQAEGAIPTNP